MDATYGECRITTLHDSGGFMVRLRVDRADPRILIAPELLREMGPPESGWAATFDGETVRIRGENRTVVYRVGRYLPEWGCYEAEWPD